MKSYRLIVEGRVLEGFDPQQVRERVCQLFKMENKPEKLDRLFGGSEVVAKHGLDAVQIERYLTTLHQAGLACRSELEEAQPVEATQGAANVTAPAVATDNPQDEPTDEEERSIAAGDPQRLSLAAGMGWIGDGFGYFRQQPLHWIGITVVMLLIYMALSMLWIMEIFSAVVSCLMSGGLMIACYKQLQGDRFTVGTLFDGFRYKFKPLAILGLLVLLLTIVALVLTLLVVMVMMGGMSALESMATTQPDLSPMAGVVLLLTIMLIWTPLIMMSWFAPALVTLNGEGPWQAMKISMKGAWRNIWPLSLFALVMFVLMIAASIPLLLGWLVMMPMIYTTQFAAYREIFCDDADQ